MQIKLIAPEKVGSPPPVRIETSMYEILQRAYQSNDLTEFQDFIYGLEKANVFGVLHIEAQLKREMSDYHASYQDSLKRNQNANHIKRKYQSVLYAMSERPKILKLSDYQKHNIVMARIYECLEVLIIWFEEGFNLKEYLTDNQRNELVRMLFFRYKDISLEEIGLVLRSAKMGEYGQVKYQLDISHFSEYMNIIRQERAKFFRDNPFKIDLIDPYAKPVDVEKIRAFREVLENNYPTNR